MFRISFLLSIIFSLFITTDCLSSNQVNIDSLENELKSSKGIKRVKLFNELSKSLCNESINKSLEYGKNALKLSLELNSKKEEAEAYNNLGLICINKASFDKALDYFNLSLSINKELNDSNKIVETLTYIGEIYYYKNDYKTSQKYFNKALSFFSTNCDSFLLASLYNDFGALNNEWANYHKALKYFNKALIISKSKNNKQGMAYSYNSIGKVYYNLGSYTKSLDYYQRSLTLFKQIRKNNSIAVLYNNIGQIYYQLKNYDKSIELYQKSIKIKEVFSNKRGIAISLKNIGNVYYYLKEFNDALKYYKESLSIEQELNNKKGIAANLNNIGLIYIEKKQYNEAIDYFNKSIKLKEEIGDLSGIANVYDNLGLLYKEKGDYRKAIKAYNKSQEIALKIKTKKIILSNYKGLYNSYSKLGHFTKAFKYSKLYIDLYDSVFNEKNQKQLALFQNKYEIEKKEKELQLLSKDKELQQIKIKKQKLVNNVFIVGIIIVILLLFLIYSRYLLKIRSNKKLQKEINERKITEKELRKAKEFIESLISNAQDGIIVLDLDGMIIQCNDAFLKMTGYDREEIKNMNFRDITPDYWQKFNDDILDDLFQDNVPKHFEKQYIKKDGSVFPIRISVSLIKNEKGEPTSIMSIINDISEEKATQEELNEYKHHLEKLIVDRTKELVIAKDRAEESDKLKTSFLANLSHEVRTPMNAIIGFSDLLADPDLTADQREEYIQLISTSGNDLVHLIDDIIDLSKLETNQIKINKTETQINEVLNNIYSYYNNILLKNHSDVELKLNIDNTSNLSINTDDFRLKQILSKLVDNSIKFTEKGYIELGYTFKEEKINFFVKDTGIGIPKDKQNKVFEKFWKDESLIKLHRGTGLGLSIAKNLVELLNGKIWFESDKTGTIFYLNIPSDNLKNNVLRNKKHVKFDDYNWNNKTILIAEDEQTNFKYLKEVLKKTNADVLWAKNGQEAVEICNSTKNIDAVLMDIKMPVLNGYEATAIIKKSNKNIPIVAQTAYAMANEREKSYKAGCDDYLTKPIKINTLLSTLNKYL